MYWYITIRSDASYGRSTDFDGISAFLRSQPELVQTGVNTFAGAPGQPWTNIALAMSVQGSYADRGDVLPAINLVDIVCSDEHDVAWYDGLASRIAAFLGWEALDEDAQRTIWP